jgi:hypothetical protein
LRWPVVEQAASTISPASVETFGAMNNSPRVDLLRRVPSGLKVSPHPPDRAAAVGVVPRLLPVDNEPLYQGIYDGLLWHCEDKGGQRRGYPRQCQTLNDLSHIALSRRFGGSRQPPHGAPPSSRRPWQHDLISMFNDQVKPIHRAQNPRSFDPCRPTQRRADHEMDANMPPRSAQSR